MYDTIIRGATILDGTGAAGFLGDVAIEAARIAIVGDLASETAAVEIDGAGLALAPGFIDAHTHDDHALLQTPDMPAKASQGVTTVVTGNCGISLAPLLCEDPPPPLDILGRRGAYRFARFADYLSALDRAPPAINCATLVGHSTLRLATMQDVARPATDPEIAAMRELLGEAMEAGAIGFSTGLFYPTNRAATPDEVVALLAELEGTGAIYATHMRDEGDAVEQSLDESFETAARAGVPLLISHHKCTGVHNFGRTRQTLAKIDLARLRQPVSLDVYPYVAGSTTLLPALVERATRTIVTWSDRHPEVAGRQLDAIAQDWGVSIEDAIARLQPAGAIYFMMDQEDVDRIIRYPHTMIGSDGLPGDAFPHPRLWGTFPRILGHYVRERGLLTLADAVHRMTGLPARWFNLPERGTVRAGSFADLVLFDPALILDRATFEAPTLPAQGIRLVMVNGTPIVVDGAPTGARPGRVLRRATKRAV